MGRTLMKEVLESRVFLAVMLALTAVFGIVYRDPFAFRASNGSDPTRTLGFIVMVIMGLGIYARELGSGAMEFTLSRPVRWWWAYLAKILAGAIVSVIVALFAAGVYQLMAPEAYRSLITWRSVLTGTALMASGLMSGFIMGFLVSCILESRASAMAILPVLWVAIALLADALQKVYNSTLPLWAIVAAAVVASLLCARSPLILARERRVRLWLMVMLGGFAATALAAFFFQQTGLLPRPPAGTFDHPSPDMQTTAYLPSPYSRPDATDPGLWFTTANGRCWQVDRQPRAKLLAWSPDSSRLLYMVSDGPTMRLREASKAENWRVHEAMLLEHGEVERFLRVWNSSPVSEAVTASWSPSGTRIALAGGIGDINEWGVVVIDPAAHHVAEITRNVKRFWWVDDNRIAIMDGDGAVKIMPVEG